MELSRVRAIVAGLLDYSAKNFFLRPGVRERRRYITSISSHPTDNRHTTSIVYSLIHE